MRDGTRGLYCMSMPVNCILPLLGPVLVLVVVMVTLGEAWRFSASPFLRCRHSLMGSGRDACHSSSRVKPGGKQDKMGTVLARRRACEWASAEARCGALGGHGQSVRCRGTALPLQDGGAGGGWDFRCKLRGEERRGVGGREGMKCKSWSDGWLHRRNVCCAWYHSWEAGVVGWARGSDRSILYHIIPEPRQRWGSRDIGGLLQCVRYR